MSLDKLDALHTRISSDAAIARRASESSCAEDMQKLPEGVRAFFREALMRFGGELVTDNGRIVRAAK